MVDELDDLDLAKTLRADGQAILAGRYRVVRELGRGGMGIVYLAEDLHLENRQVAIKMLPPVLSKNPRAIQALKKEALLTMQLSHPNIVTLRAFEQCDEGALLVMDYVDGKTLEQLLSEREQLSQDEVVRIFRPVAEALDYAHSRKVIHRDVKPSNIIVDAGGTPYIMDFGVAREMKDTFTRVTGKGTSGTLPYMSPEQLRGNPPVPAQDIYSLAASMYECLCGHPPFYTGQIEYQIVNEQPAAIEGGGAGLPARIMQALAKKPDDRPSKCGVLWAGAANSAIPVAEQPSRRPGRIELIEEPTLSVESAPSAVTVTVDGRAVGSTPLRLSLPSGEYRIQAQKEGFTAWERLIRFHGAGDAHLRIEMEANPGLVEASFPMTAQEAAKVQRAGAEALGVPLADELNCGGGVKMKLVLIPAGMFMMGSPNNEKDRLENEGPVHEVTISRSFYMGKYTVTQAQWEQVMGTTVAQQRRKVKGRLAGVAAIVGNLSRRKKYGLAGVGDNYPIYYVSWEEATEFCKKLSTKTGKTVTLPTEARWEYACRAGCPSRFSFGDADSDLALHAWFNGNSGGTNPVGQKKPNVWDLYDMHGNVWGWCSDWCEDSYANADDRDASSLGFGTYRGLRGGGWVSSPQRCRSAGRNGSPPVSRHVDVGFRVVVDLSANDEDNGPNPFPGQRRKS